MGNTCSSVDNSFAVDHRRSIEAFHESVSQERHRMALMIESNAATGGGGMPIPVASGAIIMRSSSSSGDINPLMPSSHRWIPAPQSVSPQPPRRANSSTPSEKRSTTGGMRPSASSSVAPSNDSLRQQHRATPSGAPSSSSQQHPNSDAGNDLVSVTHSAGLILSSRSHHLLVVAADSPMLTFNNVSVASDAAMTPLAAPLSPLSDRGLSLGGTPGAVAAEEKNSRPDADDSSSRNQSLLFPPPVRPLPNATSIVRCGATQPLLPGITFARIYDPQQQGLSSATQPPHPQPHPLSVFFGRCTPNSAPFHTTGSGVAGAGTGGVFASTVPTVNDSLITSSGILSSDPTVGAPYGDHRGSGAAGVPSATPTIASHSTIMDESP